MTQYADGGDEEDDDNYNNTNGYNGNGVPVVLVSESVPERCRCCFRAHSDVFIFVQYNRGAGAAERGGRLFR